jgi:hypothetical protein
MKTEQGVLKRRHIKFRSRGVTQKKAYNRSTHSYRDGNLIFIYLMRSCFDQSWQIIMEYILLKGIASFYTSCLYITGSLNVTTAIIYLSCIEFLSFRQ